MSSRGWEMSRNSICCVWLKSTLFVENQPPVFGVWRSLFQPEEGVAGSTKGETTNTISPLFLCSVSHTCKKNTQDRIELGIPTP